MFETMFMSFKAPFGGRKTCIRFLVPPLPTTSGDGQFLRNPRALFLSVCATEYRSDAMKDGQPLHGSRQEVTRSQLRRKLATADKQLPIWQERSCRWEARGE